jgi:hypothetical protein
MSSHRPFRKYALVLIAVIFTLVIASSSISTVNINSLFCLPMMNPKVFGVTLLLTLSVLVVTFSSKNVTVSTEMRWQHITPIEDSEK